MPRKAALMAEESNDSVPNSPLRRSTRSRVASSPAPQTAPIATVGRTRRSSTSSVGSDISVASVASLPAVVKGAVRGRRPSLSQESNLEKIGETGKSSDVTPVKKTRRGSISTLQDDASALSVRAGSPAVASVSNRRRSLRSASKSPTLSIKESASDYAVSNGTPSKVRDRRLSAEKTAPKRLASVALEPLVEGNEADSPKKAVSKEAAVDNDEKMEEIAEEIKTVESKETLDIIAKKEHTKNRLSTESSKETDDAKAGVSSEKINTKIDIKQIDDITKGLLTQKVREQFLSQAQVVISPLTNKIAADKLSEISELIPNDMKVNEAPEKTDSSALLNTEIIPLKNTLDDTKPTPKRTNLTTPQSPVRKSPRLISETVSDSSNTPVKNAEIPSDMSSTGRASLNSSKQSRKSISKEPTPTKDIEIKPPNKSVEVDSDESLNLSVKSTILSSQEDELNKSKQSRKSISKEPTPTIDIEIKSPSKSLNKSVEVVDGSDGSFNLSLKSTILSSQEDAGLNKSKQSRKSISKEPTPTKDIEIKSPNKSVEADSDGSFNLSLKSTILSSQEDELNKSNVINKDGDKSTNIDHKLEFSNESDKENTDKRVSNVFKSKNVEESFSEAMDVEYPSDNDESFSGANKKRASMKSLANTQLSNITSDDSTSGSLHLISNPTQTSDDNNIEQNTHETSKKNKNKKLQYFTIKSSDESETSDPESKLDQLIERKTVDLNEDSNQSGSEDNPDMFLDDEAEEVSDEDTPSEDSNDIITISDNCEKSKNKRNLSKEIIEVTEEYDSNPAQTSDDSDTEENTHEASKKNKEKQYFTVKSSDESETSDPESKLDQLIERKTVDFNEKSDQSDSEDNPDMFLDDEAEEVSDEDTPSEDSNDIIEIGENIESTDDDLEDEEYASGSDADFIDDSEAGELLSGIDNDLDYDGKVIVRKKRRILIRPVDEMEDVEIPASKDEKPVEGLPQDIDKTPNKRKSKRKSSISIQENVKIVELDNAAITEKIGNIVDVFCASFTENKTGNVTVNVSLDYHESSSSDEQTIEKNQSSEATPVKVLNTDLNESLKRKSAEKITPSPANATSTCDLSISNSSASKIKVLQEVRISPADTEIAPNQIDPPTSAKKSKNKKKRNRTSHDSLDDEVFLPDSSSNRKSEGMLATPRPSKIGTLSDNVIMELVRTEESTSKTDVSPDKKSKKRRKSAMTAEEFNMFCKPSTSHAGTAGQWNVTELTPDVKPSKCNARNLIAEGVIDMKDFKNIMIARNKLKPQRSKKSFMSTLKTRKQF